MKILTGYFLPAALVAGFLYYFFYDVLHYHVNIDDCFYNAMVDKYGITGSVSKCYNIVNGRWFSHIVCAFSFYFLKYNFSLYAFYLTFLMSLFIFGISFLYKNYLKTFHQIKISFLKAIWFGCVFNATLYFLLFEGRREIWGWVSSANNHLLSVTLCVFLFSLFIKARQKMIEYFLIIMLSAFIGGLNEVNAICNAVFAVCLLLMNKIYFPEIKLNTLGIWLSVLSISISLAVNLYSGGYKMRMEGLPDFTLGQSLKNTAHTFLIPVIHYQYLPFILCALFIFFLFLKGGLDNFKQVISLSKKEIEQFVWVLSIIILSFFLHCYTLSDIVPPRGELWGYCLLLFVASTRFAKEKQKII